MVNLKIIKENSGFSRRRGNPAQNVSDKIPFSHIRKMKEECSTSMEESVQRNTMGFLGD